MNNSADQLARLKKNDEYLTTLSVRLSLIESGTSQHFPHWRESIFNFQISQWIEALQGNNTVEMVELDLSLPVDTLWQKRTIGSFLAAVGAIPTLEKLVIRQNVLGVPHGIEPIPAIRTAIENSRCLTYLEIEGTSIRDDSLARNELQALARVIAQKNELRTFKFQGFSLDETIATALLPALQNHNIQEISLGNTSNGCQPFLDALSDNQSPLQNLKLSFSRNLNDQICDKIVDVFSDNHHLRSLSLLNATRRDRADHGISEKGFQSLAKLMQLNYTLVELKTSGCTPNQEIEFFCKLNRAGRKKLFNTEREAKRRDWVDVLCAVLAEEETGAAQDPLEFVFYILQLNPCLCEV